MDRGSWKKGVVAAGLAAMIGAGCSDNRERSGTGISDREAAAKGNAEGGSAAGAGGGSASAPSGVTGEASPSPR